MITRLDSPTAPAAQEQQPPLATLKDRFFQLCFMYLNDPKLLDVAFLKTAILKDKDEPITYSRIQFLKNTLTTEHLQALQVSNIIPTRMQFPNIDQLLNTLRIYSVTEFLADQIFQLDSKKLGGMTTGEIYIFKAALKILKEEVRSNTSNEFLINLLEPIVLNLRFKLSLPSATYLSSLVKEYPMYTDLLRTVLGFKIYHSAQKINDAIDKNAWHQRMQVLDYKIHTAYLANLYSFSEQEQIELSVHLDTKLDEIMMNGALTQVAKSPDLEIPKIDRALLRQAQAFLEEYLLKFPIKWQDVVKRYPHVHALRAFNQQHKRARQPISSEDALLFDSKQFYDQAGIGDMTKSWLRSTLISGLNGKDDPVKTPHLKYHLWDLSAVSHLLSQVEPANFFLNVNQLSKNPLHVSIYKREYLSLAFNQPGYNLKSSAYRAVLFIYTDQYLTDALSEVKKQLDSFAVLKDLSDVRLQLGILKDEMAFYKKLHVHMLDNLAWIESEYPQSSMGAASLYLTQLLKDCDYQIKLNLQQVSQSQLENKKLFQLGRTKSYIKSELKKSSSHSSLLFKAQPEMHAKSKPESISNWNLPARRTV